MANLALSSVVKTNSLTCPEDKLPILADAMHIPEKNPHTGEVYTNAQRQDLLWQEIIQPLKQAVENYKTILAGPPDITDIIQE